MCREARKLGEATLQLRDLQADLVWKHGLDFDFVRKESATLFDPNQMERCEQLIRTNMKKQGIRL